MKNHLSLEMQNSKVMRQMISLVVLSSRVLYQNRISVVLHKYWHMLGISLLVPFTSPLKKISFSLGNNLRSKAAYKNLEFH